MSFLRSVRTLSANISSVSLMESSISESERPFFFSSDSSILLDQDTCIDKITI